MKRMRRALAVGPVAALCLLLVVRCKDNPVEVQPEIAEDFILKDLNGTEVQLSKNAGKVVVLNFFNAACGTCQQQTTQLVKFYNAHASKGLVVLGVSHGDKGTLEEFADQYDVTYPILRDTTQNMKVWNYYQSDLSLPGIYIIDKDAVVLGFSFGQVLSVETLTEAVEPLL